MPLSVKTKEHFRRRMALAGPKWGALMGGAVALAGVIMFTTSALHFVTVTDTHGGSTRILTVNQTEAAVLAQAECLEFSHILSSLMVLVCRC